MSWISWGKKNDSKVKNQKLTGDSIRIRINRLINNTAVEVLISNANLIRDKSNNTILFDEENNIKEELPGQIDSLISDILYKLESHGLSKEEQLKKVNRNIDAQETIIKNENKGYVREGEDVIKINLETEKSKLRMLKCVKYTLENKKGDGFFESIELDGTRSLSYIITDGELIPYWHKTPTSDGEPIVLVPDIAQRKKFWKEATEEAINDFNESQDSMWRGILGVITKGLYVVLALALIVWTIYLARWSADMSDESLQPQIEILKLENEKIRQICSTQIASQVENNGLLIDYAKSKIEEDLKRSEAITNTDKSNIQI